MDSKYGQIYTEQDMKLIAQRVHEQATAGVPLSDIAFDAHEFTFPRDEPVFVLRGKDKAAADAIDEYKNITKAHGSPDEHILAVFNAVDSFREWAEANPEKMKVAD